MELALLGCAALKGWPTALLLGPFGHGSTPGALAAAASHAEKMSYRLYGWRALFKVHLSKLLRKSSMVGLSFMSTAYGFTAVPPACIWFPKWGVYFLKIGGCIPEAQ